MNSKDILKIELVSLILLIEKTFLSWWKNNGYFNNEDIIYKNRKQEIKNLFEDILKNINIDISNLMTNFNQQQTTINLWQHFFKDWRRWRGNNPNQITSQLKILQKLYGSCEGLNSGIEKGNPKDNIKDNIKEDIPWISNSFGSLKIVSVSNFLDIKRDNIKNQIISYLEKIKNGNFDFINDRKNFINLLKNFYLNIPSDTRYPLNDITLWDQSYMATSMFKALLYNILHNPINTNEYDLSKIKWKILGIQYDKLGLAEKGYKPSQIMWYRDISREIDKEIQDLLETEYPIGNKIYKDETGIYFIVGENFKLSNELKKEILKIFKNKTDDEFYPSFALSKASRGLMNLTTLLEQAKENFLKQDLSLKNNDLCLEYGENKFPIGVCQVCKTRIVYNTDKKDEDKNICKFCYENKTKGRLNKWLENQEGETIWIDEIADNNSRVALITLKFELNEWLNGNLLNSFISQKLDLINYTINDYIQDIFISLKEDKKLNETILIKDYINHKDQKLRAIVDTWFISRVKDTNFYYKIKPLLNIKDSIDWIMLSNESSKEQLLKLSELILQFILRKNPSPARLKRIWDTTEEFFKRIINEILDSCQGYRTKEGFTKNIPDFAHLKDEIKEDEYKQYISIIDPTPISWQFILPTNKVNDAIKKIKHLYKKEFKYVYGKLPLHIGIIVQNSKFPLYIGIKALRKIRRDIKDWQDIKLEGKDLLPNLECYEEVVEQNNNAKDYYWLYECENPDYPFYNLPSKKGIKKYNQNDEFIIYPNTIDFEFLDCNARKNDIYYFQGKRNLYLKSNRPYTWEEFENFKNFKEFFKNKTALMHRLVSLIYTKIQDWKDNEDSFKIFIESTFKQNEIDIQQFGIKDYSFDEMKKFLDMFDYYHTTLKEI